MTNPTIQKFFCDLFIYRTGENLAFELRPGQLVTPPMNEEEAVRIGLILREILPSSDVVIYPSRQFFGQFRVVFLNPEQVFKTEHIQKFFSDMYAYKTGDNLVFEARSSTQFVSLPMDEEKANNIKLTLEEMIPSAEFEVQRSSIYPKKFRLIFFNSDKVYNDLVKMMAQRLNKIHPLATDELQRCCTSWYVSEQSIEYRVDISTEHTPAFNRDCIEKNQTQLNIIAGYNKKLEELYPGLNIIKKLDDKGGCIYRVESFNYDNFNSISKIPSLRALGLSFFRENPQCLTTENLQKLPGDIVLDMNLPVLGF
ncbi:hypothetical protein [Fluoribacter gormanii]|uniref:hypothetical protein n=1 Tax=Fluoribacter gormanii TaxID=464 RepID=UPI00104136F8|nr:hypothetical protein [Fluoribacter gormanii]